MNPPEYIVTTGSAYDAKTGSDFEVLAAMEMDDDDGAGTVLTYKAEVTFSGGITSLNTRLIKPIVARDVNSYFENVKDRIETVEE
jgi:carbon monoxide dehydrogenase subunit G